MVTDKYKHIHLHKVFVAVAGVVFALTLCVGLGTFLTMPSANSRQHTSDESKKGLDKEPKELDPEALKIWEIVCNRPNSGYYCCQKGAAFCAETVSPQYLP